MLETLNQPTLWTDERIDLLKARHAAGLSAGQIASEFGVTRNTIMGKIYRLKLSPHAASAAHQRTVRKARADRDRSATQRIATMLKVRRPSNGGVTVVNTVVRDEGPVPAKFLGIAFIDLEYEHCRFPRGGEEGAPITFCGQPRADNIAYCRACAAVCFDYAGSIRSKRRAA